MCKFRKENKKETIEFKSDLLNTENMRNCKKLYDKTLTTGDYKKLKNEINHVIVDLKKTNIAIDEIYEIVENELKNQKSRYDINIELFNGIFLSLIVMIMDNILI